MKNRIVADEVDEVTLRKWMKLKDSQDHGDKTNGDFIKWLVRDVYLYDNQEEAIQRNTRNNLLRMWCGNFAANLNVIREGKLISDMIPPEAVEDENIILGPAIIIGRGPSLYKYKHLQMLAKSKFKGTVVASDGALIDCLKAGVIPNYVISVDGNRDLICKWYDHPLVVKYGKRIKAVLCVSVAHNVYEQCVKAGMDVYWFNPQFDDYRRNDSFTKIQMLMTATEKHKNGTPNVACVGNAGATSWVIATNLLRRSPVALIGIDLGYLEDTPIEETSYYKQMMEGTGGNINLVVQAFQLLDNPYFNNKVKVDPVFTQYRESWLGVLKQIRPNIRTVNCTGGGSLFSIDKSLPLEYSDFKDFLVEHSGKK